MKKILIIEDDKNIASLERDYLEVNGYEVVVESDGNKGLKEAIKNDYNLVVLDIMLPGTDGFEICKAIRKEKELKASRRIAIVWIIVSLTVAVFIQ